MVKALHFKGDKKAKKRKRVADPDDAEGSASKAVTTAAPVAKAEHDDSWVNADAPSDVSGPIVIVLPTDNPTCLACDANGKVFASGLESVVEGEAVTAATAEPHDVRQVFVANRVAGTESVSLKGHHGRYLSCDKHGVLSATATAISPEESFLVIPVPDNPSAFALQTLRDKFLSIDDSATNTPDLRGDVETITFNATLRLRMQARFKPRLKASKEEKAREKISRKELEELIGRRLEDDEVRKLKKARREGNFHETALDMKVKSSHDKYASM
ncbi:actin-crosslinking protein [Dothidotthia symphoricarpi CBS 119687]|uniref:Actin-crosslinking protein n=1 Tax=Dothidotthia symphoricarpi CBS 119687 TaxID=1392245 RepID=A0A6A6A8J9_9PLEO|nr:actin-crosslinking protein [Dothidotthia symphoricarpi CBS 119687]KAF2128170.1 actin-crosslinking protein [Dothidotthia symphoricarpi CBS 119687]